MPLRIVHIINSLAQGGAERSLTRLSLATAPLAHEQHEVVTLLDGGFFAPEIRAAGVDVTELRLRRGSSPSGTVGGRRAAQELVTARRPDVLVCWLYQSCVVGSAAKLALPRTRLIWNLRGTATPPDLMSRSHRVSVRALAMSSSLPWAIAVNSRSGRRDHEAVGFRPRRWAYVPNGFDPDDWTPDPGTRERVRRSLGVPASTVVYVMVARAEPQKDHATLLSAFDDLASRYPDVHLLLIGRGTDELEIPAASKERVSAIGARSDVRYWLAGADVGVLSSAYGEGLPNAVAEKMLAGLPCVVTDTGDAGLLVGGTGRVVAASDPASLTAALEGFANLEEGERRRRGAMARERVKERYSTAAMVKGFRRLWEDRADRGGVSCSV